MTTLNNIVKSEYDRLTKDFDKLMMNVDKYTLEFVNNDIDDKIIDVYNKDSKILSAKYQIIGTYDTYCDLFTWGWAMQIRDKKITNFEKNIKHHNAKIKKYISNKKYNDVQYLEQIMYYLSNNTFYIVENNLKLLEMLCVFIGGGKGILKCTNKSLEKSNKIIHIYYLIDDIIGT
jgi:hypothetical protein